jgi:ABC-type antimicrobial peptide transport system permease subunit
VAVGVLNTVLMSVLERRREYGVLKALGTRPRQIVKMVFSEVTLLAVVATVVGIGIGLVINSLVAQQGIRLPQAFEYGGMSFEVMKSEVNFRSFLIPAITVILSAWVVSIFPSIKAARTDPAKSMRMF